MGHINHRWKSKKGERKNHGERRPGKPWSELEAVGEGEECSPPSLGMELLLSA